MKTVALSGRRWMRVAQALPILLVCAAALVKADVTITGGTIGATGGSAPTGSVQIQGSNFSLTGLTFIGALPIFGVEPNRTNGQTVTFIPTASASAVAPLTMVYNGAAYTNIKLAVSFTAAPATAPNTFQPSTGSTNYNADISHVPFSMTGLVSVFPDSGGSAALFTVPIVGAGFYVGNAYGNYLAGGPGGIPAGAAYYQFAPSPSTFFSTDRLTQGLWNGKYGGEGFLIANGPSLLPAYAAVSLSGASTYTWAGQTADVRALQNGIGATQGLASAYYGNTFNLNINFIDSYAHAVGLYILDFDTSSRAETFTVVNANTGAVLDTETITNLHNGVYAMWALQGNITIKVTGTGGAPVVSGIFFGPTGSTIGSSVLPNSRLSFLSQDSTAQGTWTGKFGGSGYIIPGGSSSGPGTVSGALTYVWAGQTSDARALQTAPSVTTRIASAFTQYPSASFTINVNGPTQKVSLYFLDWDNAGRTETVTIRDLTTNAILDTRTVSGFQGGLYLSWLISGNVVIKVTPAGTYSPAVSGIFFN